MFFAINIVIYKKNPLLISLYSQTCLFLHQELAQKVINIVQASFFFIHEYSRKIGVTTIFLKRPATFKNRVLFIRKLIQIAICLELCIFVQETDQTKKPSFFFKITTIIIINFQHNVQQVGGSFFAFQSSVVKKKQYPQLRGG